MAWPHNRGTLQEEEGGTWLMDAETGTQRRKIWHRSAESLDWSPDSRSLRVSSPDDCAPATVTLAAARPRWRLV